MGTVHDWVHEHRARLQVAFTRAQERLNAAAVCRKEHHDRGVKEARLIVGQQVFLREHGIRGRQKIQDLWSPTVYQVLRAPVGEGAVYTIAPVDDLTKSKTVHRTMIKARLGTSVQATPVPSFPQASQVPSLLPDEDPEPDLWIQVTNPDLVSREPLPTVEAAELSPTNLLAQTTECAVPTPASASPIVQEDSPCSAADRPLRRTSRATAGHHSNVHHLPQTACPSSSGGATSAVVAFGVAFETLIHSKC
ncbi:uncharacterized protein LOC121680987 [Alosa sapidissima]|uniref:uncharacterized protein LOC121680987 n=1 Tax=Alosa sapidissima TaxID=34773 RepID=UPI001C08038D|nr:uncharacterized protein LOC121680987 [Alosa sapidissima]